MALLVSAMVKTERSALTSVPLLLVPQMLLAGALVPFKEMNHALFDTVDIKRERGGTPVPASIMPLRYAYEAMVIAQATRNPFEKERMRLQRRLEDLSATRELTKETAERLEVLKIALTKLLAAGAYSASEAESLSNTISYVGRKGTRDMCLELKVWPPKEGEKKVHQIADYFVNARIDLMTREADTHRTDYRNEKNRAIFLALKQPLWGKEWMQTDRRNGFVLALIILSCPAIASLILSHQNRKA